MTWIGEIVAARRLNGAGYLGGMNLVITLVGEHEDDRTAMEIQVPAHLEKSYAVGRRVRLTIQPLR